MSVGSYAITSQNQVITVLGYTTSEMSGELSQEDLKKHRLTKMPQSDKSKLVGLFFDKDAKGIQEILTVPIFDVCPLFDLDEKSLKELA